MAIGSNQVGYPAPGPGARNTTSVGNRWSDRARYASDGPASERRTAVTPGQANRRQPGKGTGNPGDLNGLPWPKPPAQTLEPEPGGPRCRGLAIGRGDRRLSLLVVPVRKFVSVA